MLRHRLSRIMLLGGVGVLALLAAPVPGQEQPAARSLPAAWGTTGNETPPAPVSGPPAVIATSRDTPPTLPRDARLPLPDDGLKPVTPPPPPPDLLPPVAPKPAPAPSPVPPVQQATHVAPADGPAGGEATGVVKVVSAAMTRDPLPATGQGCGLQVEATGPTTAAPGEELTYQLVARNAGGQALAGVRVELPLPGSVRPVSAVPAYERQDDRLVWRVGNLDVAAERRFKVVLAAVQPGELAIRPVATFAAAAGVRCNVVRPPFAAALTGPESVALGEKANFQIVIMNNSPEPSGKVVLRCELGDGLTHPQGGLIEAELPEELAPGQERSIQLEAQASKLGRCPVVLTASASHGRTARATLNVTVRESVLTVRQDGPRKAALGQEIALRMEVTNPGREGAAVRATAWLPDGFEFVSASDGGGYTPAARAVAWALTAPATGNLTVTYKVRAKQPGDWALHAAARGEGVNEGRTVHAIHVDAVTTLAVELIAHDDPLAYGTEGMVDVRVYNAGVTAAEAVAVNVDLPDNLLLTGAEGPTRWRAEGQRVRFEPLAGMRPRVDAIYRLRVRGVRGGEGRFRAEARAAGSTAPVQQELTSHVRGGPPAPFTGR
ncbi:MAG: hypothetical protein U0736_05440 [Gemmataceae bacterium]